MLKLPGRIGSILTVILLWGIQFSLNLGLVLAANRQEVLTKEEASNGFVYPAFLQLHLQHHTYSTNFYSYLFFAAVGDIFPSLFFARFAKAAAMAMIPPLVYFYLRRRFHVPMGHAVLSAIAISLLPGIVCFSWLGVDMGIETAVGFLAVCLTLFDSRAAIVASFAVAAVGAGCYGSAFVFVPVVVFEQLPRLRKLETRLAVVWGSVLMLVLMVFPLFWGTNVQTLFIGGGKPAAGGALARLLDLMKELFAHGNSYYFFTNGAPAFGAAMIGLACVAGLTVVSFRNPARSWPMLAVVAGTLAMYSIAGNVPGARRVMPLLLCLGIFGALLLDFLGGPIGSWRRIAAGALMVCAIAFEFRIDNGIRRSMADSTLPLPHDFEFRIPAGETMASTVSEFVSGSRKLPENLDGYEPDRTLGILYRLTQPHPIVSSKELIAACDRHGWSIPSTARRLARFRRRP